MVLAVNSVFGYISVEGKAVDAGTGQALSVFPLYVRLVEPYGIKTVTGETATIAGSDGTFKFEFKDSFENMDVILGFEDDGGNYYVPGKKFKLPKAGSKYNLGNIGLRRLDIGSLGLFEAEVSGRVIDSLGNPLKGVKLDIRHSTQHFDKSAVTDEKGNYRVYLVFGAYFATASLEGYSSKDFSFDVETGSRYDLLIGTEVVVAKDKKIVDDVVLFPKSVAADTKKEAEEIINQDFTSLMIPTLDSFWRTDFNLKPFKSNNDNRYYFWNDYDYKDRVPIKSGIRVYYASDSRSYITPKYNPNYDDGKGCSRAFVQSSNPKGKVPFLVCQISTVPEPVKVLVATSTTAVIGGVEVSNLKEWKCADSKHVAQAKDGSIIKVPEGLVVEGGDWCSHKNREEEEYFAEGHCQINKDGNYRCCDPNTGGIGRAAKAAAGAVEVREGCEGEGGLLSEEGITFEWTEAYLQREMEDEGLTREAAIENIKKRINNVIRPAIENDFKPLVVREIKIKLEKKDYKPNIFVGVGVARYSKTEKAIYFDDKYKSDYEPIEALYHEFVHAYQDQLTHEERYKDLVENQDLSKFMEALKDKDQLLSFIRDNDKLKHYYNPSMDAETALKIMIDNRMVEEFQATPLMFPRTMLAATYYDFVEEYKDFFPTLDYCNNKLWAISNIQAEWKGNPPDGARYGAYAPQQCINIEEFIAYLLQYVKYKPEIVRKSLQGEYGDADKYKARLDAALKHKWIMQEDYDKVMSAVPAEKTIAFDYVVEINGGEYYGTPKKRTYPCDGLFCVETIGVLFDKYLRGVCEINLFEKENNGWIKCLGEIPPSEFQIPLEGETSELEPLFEPLKIKGGITRKKTSLKVTDNIPPRFEFKGFSQKSDTTLHIDGSSDELGLDVEVIRNGEKFTYPYLEIKDGTIQVGDNARAYGIDLEPLEVGTNEISVIAYDLAQNPSEKYEFSIEVDGIEKDIDGVRFWFYGRDAKESISNFMPQFKEIAQTIKEFFYIFNKNQKENFVVAITSNKEKCSPMFYTQQERHSIVKFDLNCFLGITPDFSKEDIPLSTSHEIAHAIYPNFNDFNQFHNKLLNTFKEFEVIEKAAEMIGLLQFRPWILVTEGFYSEHLNDLEKGIFVGHPKDSASELHSSTFVLYRYFGDKFAKVIKSIKQPELREDPFKVILEDDFDKDSLYNTLTEIWARLRDTRFGGKVFTKNGIDPFSENPYEYLVKIDCNKPEKECKTFLIDTVLTVKIEGADHYQLYNIETGESEYFLEDNKERQRTLKLEGNKDSGYKVTFDNPSSGDGFVLDLRGSIERIRWGPITNEKNIGEIRVNDENLGLESKEEFEGIKQLGDLFEPEIDISHIKTNDVYCITSGFLTKPVNALQKAVGGEPVCEGITLGYSDAYKEKYGEADISKKLEELVKFIQEKMKPLELKGVAVYLTTIEEIGSLYKDISGIELNPRAFYYSKENKIFYDDAFKSEDSGIFGYDPKSTLFHELVHAYNQRLFKEYPGLYSKERRERYDSYSIRLLERIKQIKPDYKSVLERPPIAEFYDFILASEKKRHKNPDFEVSIDDFLDVLIHFWKSPSLFSGFASFSIRDVIPEWRSAIIHERLWLDSGYIPEIEPFFETLDFCNLKLEYLYGSFHWIGLNYIGPRYGAYISSQCENIDEFIAYLIEYIKFRPDIVHSSINGDYGNAELYKKNLDLALEHNWITKEDYEKVMSAVPSPKDGQGYFPTETEQSTASLSEIERIIDNARPSTAGKPPADYEKVKTEKIALALIDEAKKECDKRENGCSVKELKEIATGYVDTASESVLTSKEKPIVKDFIKKYNVCAGKCWESDNGEDNPLVPATLKYSFDVWKEIPEYDVCSDSSILYEKYCNHKCTSEKKAIDCSRIESLSAGVCVGMSGGAACGEKNNALLREIILEPNPPKIYEPLKIKFLLDNAKDIGEVWISMNYKNNIIYEGSTFPEQIGTRDYEEKMIKEGDYFVFELSKEKVKTGRYIIDRIGIKMNDNNYHAIIPETSDTRFKIEIKPSKFEVLFFPVNWKGSEEEYESSQGRVKNNLMNYFPLASCQEEVVNYKSIPISELNCPQVQLNHEGVLVDCIQSFISSNWEYNNDWNLILGLSTDLDSNPRTAGWSLSTRKIIAVNIFSDEERHTQIIAHEIGHIYGLAEGYMIGCDNCGEPNPLKKEYGCDPTINLDCCGRVGTCKGTEHDEACAKCSPWNPEGNQHCVAGCVYGLSGTLSYEEAEQKFNEGYRGTGICGPNSYSRKAISCLGNLNRHYNGGRNIMGFTDSKGPLDFDEPSWEWLNKQPELQCSFYGVEG